MYEDGLPHGVGQRRAASFPLKKDQPAHLTEQKKSAYLVKNSIAIIVKNNS